MSSLLQDPEVLRCLRLGDAIFELLAQVPPGKVTTFGDLAVALGDPIAARAVGNAVLHHPHKPGCPCHRVVRVDGTLGRHIEGDEDYKASLLRSEGVVVESGRVDPAATRFMEFDTFRPLCRLAEIQRDLTKAARICRREIVPETIAGVDVSYIGPDRGVAAYVEIETATGKLTRRRFYRGDAPFPYVTSYLAFRELPLLIGLLDAVDAAGELAPLILVDGSGMLHQRHAGIATHLGVLFDVPTVGVTKKLLCGSVDIRDMDPDESRPVTLDGKEVGRAIRPTTKSKRPLFVSPGHRVDVPFCEIAVRRMLLGRRLPEPIYWADRLSRAETKKR